MVDRKKIWYVYTSLFLNILQMHRHGYFCKSKEKYCDFSFQAKKMTDQIKG